MLTIGSLCTGIGGLDLAVEHHFDANLLWYSDIDPKANEVMAVHRPLAWALGDFTEVDPATVEVPDILTAGFPCQSVSVAGRHEGTTSPFWLFDDIVTFIEGLPSRPTWMVLENVRNLLSHDDGRTALGVFRQVADLGFDLEYGVVRASDAGLPHKRERFFAVATHTDALDSGRGRPRQVPGTPGTGEGQGPERQRVRPTAGHGSPPATDADGERLQEQPAEPLSTPPELPGPSRPHGPTGYFDFGSFEPAIRQAEAATGVPVPAPLDGNALNPEFVAWCMGFDPDWTSGLDLSRNQQLRLLGNAVAPPQAALALELLTD